MARCALTRFACGIAVSLVEARRPQPSHILGRARGLLRVGGNRQGQRQAPSLLRSHVPSLLGDEALLVDLGAAAANGGQIIGWQGTQYFVPANRPGAARLSLCNVA
eukprot:scaffold148969_cov27-Tisochrysis_lutea.AAC.3